MEIFKNKFLVKLIATICLFLTLFNFAGTTSVYAAKGDEEVWGGVLVNPIVKLLTAIGDTIMEILHKSIQEQQAAIIKVVGTTNWLAKVGAVIAGLVIGLAVAVAIVAAVIATGGFAAWAAAAIAAGSAAATFTVTISAGTVAAGALAGVYVGCCVADGLIPEDIYLPAFSITAEEIFSNELYLFDVNFFEPNKYERTEMVPKEISNQLDENEETDWLVTGLEIFEKSELEYKDTRSLAEGYWSYPKEMTVKKAYKKDGYKKIIDLVNNSGKLTEEQKITEDMTFKIYKKKFVEGNTEDDSGFGYSTYKCNGNKHIYMFGIIDNDTEEEYLYIKHMLTESYTSTTYTGSDTQITDYVGKEVVGFELAEEGTDPTALFEEVTVEVESVAAQLQGIVATWYFILRNIALLVLMLLLIYSGIRIVLGSTAGEKAKYKERIMDWLVAVCLIFVMHYIMVFAVEIVEKITDLIGKTVNQNVVFIELTEDQAKNVNKENDNGETIATLFDTTGDGDAIDESLGGSHGTLVWPTDLAGSFRIQSQMTDEGTSSWVGYSFCYFVLTLFTLFFAFTYAKRVLYMAFLTMIAPLVAMTYPIDKISDGKAQAFDAWLKEYIFNLMIQPMHLLLYSILVTSAYTLASESPVYALVAVGFMMPAEKLMRRFFGFEKAKTPGLLGGAAGAAIAMSGLQSVLKGGKGGGNSGNGNNNNGKANNQNKVKMARANNINALDTIAGNTPRQPGGGSQTVRQQGNNTNAGQQNGGNLDAERQRLASERSVLDEFEAEGATSDSWTDGDYEAFQELEREQLEQEERLRMQEQANNQNHQANGGNGNLEAERQRLAAERSVLDEFEAEGATSDSWTDDDYEAFQELEREQLEQEERLRMEEQENRAEPVNTTGGTPPIRQQQPPVNNNANNNPVNVIHDETGRTHNRHFWGAVGTATLGAGKQLAVGALTGIHPLKAAGRIAAGAATGAIGLGLGVASGDPNKAFQYTTAGAVAGSSFAKSLSNTKLIDGAEMSDDIKEAYYGEDYQSVMLDKERERFEKNRQNLEYLKKTLKLKDTKEAKAVMEDTGRKCFDKGITDIEDIATIHQLRNDRQNSMSFEYAVAARNYAKKRLPTDTKSMSQDKIDKYKDTWAQEFREKGYQNSKQLADNAWNAAVRFNKAKSGLKDL